MIHVVRRQIFVYLAAPAKRPSPVRRTLERGDLGHAGRDGGADGALTKALQHGATAQLAGPQTPAPAYAGLGSGVCRFLPI